MKKRPFKAGDWFKTGSNELLFTDDTLKNILDDGGLSNSDMSNLYYKNTTPSVIQQHHTSIAPNIIDRDINVMLRRPLFFNDDRITYGDLRREQDKRISLEKEVEDLKKKVKAKPRRKRKTPSKPKRKKSSKKKRKRKSKKKV